MARGMAPPQNIHPINTVLFSSPLRSTESYCCHFDVDVGVGVTLKSLTSKFFYVMGKALSGELSCSGTGLVNVSYDGSMPQVWHLFAFLHFFAPSLHLFKYQSMFRSHVYRKMVHMR